MAGVFAEKIGRGNRAAVKAISSNSRNLLEFL
jgi:hypothetical protein